MHATAVEVARHAGERLHHFPGGLRLRHHKQVSCELPIAGLPLPPLLCIPLLQHAGEDATALVESGQTVLKGQVIGRHDTPAPGLIHAPTSGRIVGLDSGPISHPSGMAGVRVLLEPDGQDRWQALHPLPDWQLADPGDLRARIACSGIVGLGGAVFPTALKLGDASAAEIHTLIVNGAECEPYISCDEMLMRECPDRVVAGARILQRSVGARRALIAIESQMQTAGAALQAALARQGADDVALVRVPSIYPEGGERQLIQVLTGLEVRSGGRPSDLGLLCQNVATAAAVAVAVIEGKPLIERIVTVTGNGVARPRNLVALIGSPVSALVQASGGYRDGAARLVVGGPMMGYSLPSDDSPVVKASNCILVLSAADLAGPQPEMPCIRCGECARVCPASLLPQQLHWQVRNELLDAAHEQGLLDCIECGCCDFVCPSHIPLVEWFRFGKSGLRALAAGRTRAALARARFEARAARLQSLEQQRQERMEAKTRALGEEAAVQRDIAAALDRAQSRGPAGSSAQEEPPAQQEPRG